MSVDTLPVAELEKLPTLSEFSKYVHKSQPFVVRGGARSMQIFDLWQNDTYLVSKIGHVNVRVRKSKYRDNVFHYNTADSELTDMTFSRFIQAIQQGEGGGLYLAQGNLQWGGNVGSIGVLLKDLEPLGFDQFLDLKHVQLWMGYGEKRNPLHLGT